jgi:hypothetical protein
MYFHASRWLMAVVGVAGLGASAEAQLWVPTNFGNGADAEVRESGADQERGSSTELGLRVWDAGVGVVTDRNSAIYLKFDLTGYTEPTVGDAALRLTYRNTSLTEDRIQRTVLPNVVVRTGLTFYGLDTGLTWNESTITYNTAPGITPDGDIGTRDFNSDLTLLGSVDFPDIGTQNHLPIGGELLFAHPALTEFVSSAYAGGADEVTIVATLNHDGSNPIADWINYNYLFNPKEQTTLNTDSYDPDGNGSIGNLYGTDNSMGQFSPALRLSVLPARVPEPATVVVLSIMGMAAICRRMAGRVAAKPTLR